MILKEYDLSVRLPQERAIDTGITLVQNDKDVYKLNVRIFDGVNEIDYTDVTSATITFLKGDKNVVQGDMTVGANALTYTMGTNEIAHPGSVLASIQLFGTANERLTSARFRFDVVRDLITPSAVQSTSEFPILQRIVQDVEDVLPLLPGIEDAIDGFPEIQEFFSTAEASEAERIANEATRQTQEAARQASIADIEDRFDNLTVSQQQDAEVIDSRDGEASLNARLSRDKSVVDAHLAGYASLFLTNPDAKNSIYRGKYLGNTVTSEQYQAISGGTFEDLYIGDYWTINGVNWRIAAFNYYRNTGDSNVPGNHIVVVPDTPLYSHVMNDTDTTEGGYIGSKMYTEGLEQAKTIINNAFSGHVVTFRAFLCNAVTNGEASGGAWVDSAVDLMNEIMVCGSVVNGAATQGLYNIGTEKSQLPLFALNPQSINTRYSYWLRDVASALHFADVGDVGYARRSSASASRAVRPRFLIS